MRLPSVARGVPERRILDVGAGRCLFPGGGPPEGGGAASYPRPRSAPQARARDERHEGAAAAREGLQGVRQKPLMPGRRWRPSVPPPLGKDWEADPAPLQASPENGRRLAAARCEAPPVRIETRLGARSCASGAGFRSNEGVAAPGTRGLLGPDPGRDPPEVVAREPRVLDPPPLIAEALSRRAVDHRILRHPGHDHLLPAAAMAQTRAPATGAQLNRFAGIEASGFSRDRERGDADARPPRRSDRRLERRC